MNESRKSPRVLAAFFVDVCAVLNSLDPSWSRSPGTTTERALAAIRRLGEKAEARAADPFGEDGRLFFVASAAPSDETLRLAGVIADKIEDGTLFQAGIFSRRDLADKIRAVVRFARQGVPPAALESAPVAGEVQPVAYRVLRKQHDGEWVTDGRAWCDGVPTQDLVDDIALRSDGWRIEYAFAAPTAQAAPAAQGEPSDPLQGAANWLLEAINGCNISTLQSHLKIGFNRAERLMLAARAAAAIGEKMP